MFAPSLKGEEREGCEISILDENLDNLNWSIIMIMTAEDTPKKEVSVCLTLL